MCQMSASRISKWGVSSVTVMSDMFARATSLNGDISKLDVFVMTGMRDMFDVPNDDISKWDVSRSGTYPS